MTGSVATQGYFLTTDRLGFRIWRTDDLDLAVVLWSDPEVARYIHAQGPPDRAAVAERLQREIATQDSYGFQYWPIFLRADGDHVGCCGLRPYRSEQGIHELGVHLRPCYWQKGLAVEAARAAIDFAFSRAGARALFAGHNPANAASRRMLEKLGFRYTHDELYPPTGLNHPSYLLSRD